MRILEMQWILQQLTALSGAAERKDYVEWDDDDDPEGDVFNYRGASPDPEDLRRPTVTAH